ncbi:Uncharacterised protein [Candidatus Bilamarchaeum dharawalense]|uniref:N-acetyltransferase domain-containing protein n=1 Tax=Candidatus Bilamarchaeum dharawalense TaxID=2885759 RepID=A0A5E4LQR2_9ARCH|nr:Uncharacterised protein [Candidatus Bilamarchaeum dharawalense]
MTQLRSKTVDALKNRTVAMEGIHLRNLDITKIIARHEPELDLLQKGVALINSYFPPEEQVPPEAWEGAISAGRFGHPKNRYRFTLAMKGEEVVGVSSYFYLAEPSTLFVGFIRVADSLQKIGVGYQLFSEMLNFALDSATDAGTVLRSICGEVERPGSFTTNPADAKKRLTIFTRAGAGLLDHTTGFDYIQPISETEALPLDLILAPLEPKTHVTLEETATLVRSIFSAIYEHLPPSVFQASLDRVLRSIPASGIPLVTEF